MSLSKKKKRRSKGLGGKKPQPRRQLMKTLAHYRSRGVPLGFIQDSIISGAGIDRTDAGNTRNARTQAVNAGKTAFKYDGETYTTAGAFGTKKTDLVK